jgi:hypothetical protein
MNGDDFIEKILNDTSSANKESFLSLAKYLSTYHLTTETAYLFMKIIGANLPDALEILFKNKSPETFFSTLKINRGLICGALEILVKCKQSEIDSRALLSMLGILSAAYKNGRAGFGIYKLNFSDIHHIAKYLLKEDKKSRDIIINILESIWNYDNKSETGVLAINIVNSFFDKKKKLSDIVPENLLL